MSKKLSKVDFMGQVYGVFRGVPIDERKPRFERRVHPEEDIDPLHKLFEEENFPVETDERTGQPWIGDFGFLLKKLDAYQSRLSQQIEQRLAEMLLDTPRSHIRPFLTSETRAERYRHITALAYMIIHIPKDQRPTDDSAADENMLDQDWLSRFMAIRVDLLPQVSPVLLEKYNTYAENGRLVDDPEVYIDTLRKSGGPAHEAFVKRYTLAASYMDEKNKASSDDTLTNINKSTIARVEVKARNYLIGAAATSVVGVGLGLSGCLMPVLNEMVPMMSSAGTASLLTAGAAVLALTVVVVVVLLSKREQYTPKGMQGFWGQRDQLAQERVAKLPVPSPSCEVA